MTTDWTPAQASAAEVLSLLADWLEEDAEHYRLSQSVDMGERLVQAPLLALRASEIMKRLRAYSPAHLRALAAAQSAPATILPETGLREWTERLLAELEERGAEPQGGYGLARTLAVAVRSTLQPFVPHHHWGGAAAQPAPAPAADAGLRAGVEALRDELRSKGDALGLAGYLTSAGCYEAAAMRVDALLAQYPTPTPPAGSGAEVEGRGE